MVPEILRSLSPAIREKVLAACVPLSFGPGKTVIEENSLDQDLYFLQQGQLLVRSLSRSGIEVAFRVLDAGDCFGEFAAIDGLPRSASVETITQVSLARLPRERFLALMRNEPDFAMAIAEMITKRARAMSAQLYEMATLKLADRLRLELRRLALAQGFVSGEALIYPAPTHQSLAARLATTRETVSRELSRLAHTGLITCGRQRIIITDLARLTVG
ncbi:MAG: Crp/Fnr family transcriptional regulator [Roseomonas sp.]|nr:Crp/Fnr family transcriptional regulator [Roseomonas sp.]